MLEKINLNNNNNNNNKSIEDETIEKVCLYSEELRRSINSISSVKVNRKPWKKELSLLKVYSINISGIIFLVYMLIFSIFTFFKDMYLFYITKRSMLELVKDYHPILRFIFLIFILSIMILLTHKKVNQHIHHLVKKKGKYAFASLLIIVSFILIGILFAYLLIATNIFTYKPIKVFVLIFLLVEVIEYYIKKIEYKNKLLNFIMKSKLTMLETLFWKVRNNLEYQMNVERMNSVRVNNHSLKDEILSRNQVLKREEEEAMHSRITPVPNITIDRPDSEISSVSSLQPKSNPDIFPWKDNPEVKKWYEEMQLKRKIEKQFKVLYYESNIKEIKKDMRINTFTFIFLVFLIIALPNDFYEDSFQKLKW